MKLRFRRRGRRSILGLIAVAIAMFVILKFGIGQKAQERSVADAPQATQPAGGTRP